MDKSGLLKSIAETAYNVGFGAKKHFATFDIVEKTPGWIGLMSLSVGILGLVFERLSSKIPSAALAIAGIASLYISFYRSAEYDLAGRKLTQIFNELRDLYRSVQSGSEIEESEARLKELENEYYSISISKQILFSDWFAHLKFFTQYQISWIDEQLHFNFWRDKLPASARFIVPLVVLIIVWSAVAAFGWVQSPIGIVSKWLGI